MTMIEFSQTVTTPHNSEELNTLQAEIRRLTDVVHQGGRVNTLALNNMRLRAALADRIGFGTQVSTRAVPNEFLASLGTSKGPGLNPHPGAVTLGAEEQPPADQDPLDRPDNDHTLTLLLLGIAALLLLGGAT